jgi:hypothetical protein
VHALVEFRSERAAAEAINTEYTVRGVHVTVEKVPRAMLLPSFGANQGAPVNTRVHETPLVRRKITGSTMIPANLMVYATRAMSMGVQPQTVVAIFAEDTADGANGANGGAVQGYGNNGAVQSYGANNGAVAAYGGANNGSYVQSYNGYGYGAYGGGYSYGSPMPVSINNGGHIYTSPPVMFGPYGPYSVMPYGYASDSTEGSGDDAAAGAPAGN